MRYTRNRRPRPCQCYTDTLAMRQLHDQDAHDLVPMPAIYRMKLSAWSLLSNDAYNSTPRAIEIDFCPACLADERYVRGEIDHTEADHAKEVAIMAFRCLVALAEVGRELAPPVVEEPEEKAHSGYYEERLSPQEMQVLAAEVERLTRKRMSRPQIAAHTGLAFNRISRLRALSRMTPEQWEMYLSGELSQNEAIKLARHNIKRDRIKKHWAPKPKKAVKHQPGKNAARPRPDTLWLADEARKLWEEGYTFREVGEALGVKRRTARDLIDIGYLTSQERQDFLAARISQRTAERLGHDNRKDYEEQEAA